MALIDEVKVAMRITKDTYNSEITSLIDAACGDLGIAGISATSTTDDAVLKRAIITYCRLYFGTPDDYDRLKKAYDEMKSQMQTASGYGLPSDDLGG